MNVFVWFYFAGMAFTVAHMLWAYSGAEEKDLKELKEATSDAPFCMAVSLLIVIFLWPLNAYDLFFRKGPR